jgi:capsular polysaccharide biosynthesis protein
LLQFKTTCFLGNRIYVSRANAKTRKITNEREVQAILNDHGFRTVYLENYSFCDQLTIISEAKILVGPHGAGLSHMMFMQKNSKVMELRPSGTPQNNCYFNLANAFELQYYYQLCSSEDGSSDFQESNLQVNISDFEANIKRLVE